MESGMAKQDILDYFGFKGTYDPTNPLFNNNAGAAVTNSKTGDIFYNEGAFNYGYDRLALNANHELIHSQNVLSGKYEGIKIDYDISGKEEWSTLAAARILSCGGVGQDSSLFLFGSIRTVPNYQI